MYVMYSLKIIDSSIENKNLSNNVFDAANKPNTKNFNKVSN